MIVELMPRRPAFGENMTDARSSEFAAIIRGMEKVADPPKLEGRFSIYRRDKGNVVIKLEFDIKRD